MSLEGTWYNELGSEMTLQITQTTLCGSSQTVLCGTYQTKVGDASGIYNLVGAFDTDPSSNGQALGFVVAWVNQQNGSSNSVTCWSGQYQMIDGEEVLTAFWLLTAETPISSDWQATLIGKDVFTRNEPPQEQVARALKSGPASHPLT